MTPERASIRMVMAKASAPSRPDSKFPLLSIYSSNKQRDGPLLAPTPLNMLPGATL